MPAAAPDFAWLGAPISSGSPVVCEWSRAAVEVEPEGPLESSNIQSSRVSLVSCVCDGGGRGGSPERGSA
jgi:hypothetical protein